MKNLLFIFVFIPIFSFGQVVLEESLQKEIVLEGNVTDVNGMPLTGVSFLVNGKSNGVSSNFDGNFSLKAKIGDVLVVRSSGFKTKEITLRNQIKIDITLEDDVKSENISSLTKKEIRKNKSDSRKDKRYTARKQYLKNKKKQDIDLLDITGQAVKAVIGKNNRYQ